MVWSGDPLSTSTVALETWIDGKKYFDRAADLAARPALESERAGARREGEGAGRGDGDETSPPNSRRPAPAKEAAR